MRKVFLQRFQMLQDSIECRGRGGFEVDVEVECLVWVGVKDAVVEVRIGIVACKFRLGILPVEKGEDGIDVHPCESPVARNGGHVMADVKSGVVGKFPDVGFDGDGAYGDGWRWRLETKKVKVERQWEYLGRRELYASSRCGCGSEQRFIS